MAQAVGANAGLLKGPTTTNSRHSPQQRPGSGEEEVQQEAEGKWAEVAA